MSIASFSLPPTLQDVVNPSNDSGLLVLEASGNGEEILPVTTPCAVYEKPRAFLNCSAFSWGVFPPEVTDGGCSAEPYAGSVCRQQLLEWQECLVGKLDIALVTPVDKNSSRLDSVVSILQLLLGKILNAAFTTRRTKKQTVKYWSIDSSISFVV